MSPFELAVDRGTMQIVDVVEVAKQRTGRDAGPLRDLPGARLVHALFEQLDERMHDRAAVLRAAEATAVDFVRSGQHLPSLNY